MNFNLDLRILERHPIALAKVTEALAEVYFANVLKDVDISQIDAAYTKAFNLCPNYRIILQGKLGYEKYDPLIKELAEITSLPLYLHNPATPIQNNQ